MIKTKKQMFIVIGAFALVMLLGTVTYAFFNYTRTGTANVIRTGQINFTTTQTSGQNGAISLTNVFPVDVSEGIPANDPNVGEVTINITGDTEYTGGIEYLVSAVNVTNTVGDKTIPIGINVTATSGLGTSDTDYFTDKENNPQTSIYKVLAGDTIESNTDLLVGYIKSGETGVNGNVVIKAYLDDSKIAISDTYYENATATPTPTAPTDEYGTPASFGEGKVVLTTTEWNSLQSSGVSFQIKVEANEGTWVEEPIPTIPSCPGCKFMYPGGSYEYGTNGSTLEDIANNGDTLVDDYTLLNDNIFFGIKIENNKIAKAYACGIKRENPNNGTAFCLEGSIDGSTYVANSTLLNDPITGLWQGGCTDDGNSVKCNGVLYADAYDNGYVSVANAVGADYCNVRDDGLLYCY